MDMMEPEAETTSRLSDETERMEIAARVREQPLPTAEQYLRDQHEESVARLADLRANRDGLNEQIKVAVEDEDVLRRAVAVFDRAAKSKETTDGS